MRIAPHGDAQEAEFQAAREFGQSPLAAFAARGGVADDADSMSGRRLEAGEIHDVPEEATDGRAEDVKNPVMLNTSSVVRLGDHGIAPGNISPGIVVH